MASGGIAQAGERAEGDGGEIKEAFFFDRAPFRNEDRKRMPLSFLPGM